MSINKAFLEHSQKKKKKIHSNSMLNDWPTGFSHEHKKINKVIIKPIH